MGLDHVLSCIWNIEKKLFQFLQCPVVSGDQNKETNCCTVYASASSAGNGKDNRLSYTDKILDIMKNIGRSLVLLFDTVQYFSTFKRQVQS